MNKSRKWIAGSSLVLLAAAVLVPYGHAQRTKTARSPGPSEDFFITSSVDLPKHKLVLKLPTEVTMLMTVTDTTAYLDEKGKPIRFSDLRAGDTVFIRHEKDRDGQEIASRIRKGPMTVEELHRRYLKFP